MISLLLAWGIKLSLRWVQYILNTAKLAAFLPIKLCLGCLAWSLNWLAKVLALCGQAPACYSGSLQVEVLRLQAARQTELIENQAMEAQALQAMIAQLKDSRARAVHKCKASQERQRLLTESLQSALIQHQQHRGLVKASERDAGIVDTLKSPAATPRRASHDRTLSQQLPPLPPTPDARPSVDTNGKPSSQAHLSSLNHLLHQHSGMGGVYMAPDDGSLSAQSMRSVDSSCNLSSNGTGVGGHSKAARQRQQHHQQLRHQQQPPQQQPQQQYHHQSAQPGSKQSKSRVAWGAHLGIMLAALAMRWLSDKEEDVAERLPASLVCEPVPTSMTRLLWWPVLALYILWVLRLVGGGQVTSRLLSCWGWAVLGYGVHGIVALQQAEAKFAWKSGSSVAAAAAAAAAAAGSKGAARGGGSSCDVPSGPGYCGMGMCGSGPVFEGPTTL